MNKPLTPRETEILYKMGAGKSTKEIAFELGVSDKDIEYHRANLASKLKLKSVQEITAYASQNGFVEKPGSLEVMAPVNVKRVEDLEDLIFKTTENAVNGKANLSQVTAVIGLVGAYITIQRLKMEPRWPGSKGKK